MGETGAVSEPAPAKLNLFLNVLGRREDGYHDIRSLILPITLADGVQARRAERLLLTVVGECAADVPRREDNLVVRAAHALAEARPVLVGGRGDIVEPAEVPRTWWVLLTQPFAVRAADAYRWWDEDGGPPGPDPEPLVEALRSGEVERAGSLLSNDLDGPVAARHPEVNVAKKRLLEAGAVGALMVGSGPTVAGFVRDGYQAEDVAAATGGIATSVITRS